MMANHVLQKIKDNYVSQYGAIVRDNVPISYREWKGKADNPHAVPDSRGTEPPVVPLVVYSFIFCCHFPYVVSPT
jgi:hypothetical protein